MTGKVRDGLEADLKYLQGGHDLWKSAEAELRKHFCLNTRSVFSTFSGATQVTPSASRS